MAGGVKWRRCALRSTYCSILLSILSASVVEMSEFNLPDKDILKRGESSLKSLERHADALQQEGGSCWKSALDNLKSDCKTMGETEQRIMALRFANCHLQRSGLQTFPCTVHNFLTCTGAMARTSYLAFSTYTEFFGKVIDICHYLKSDLWMERTRKTIHDLTETSAEVVDRLVASSEKQDQLLSIQHLSLKNQDKMLQNGKTIRNSIDASAKAAQKEFSEAKLRAEEKTKWLDSSFDKVFGYLNRISNVVDSLFSHYSVIHISLFYLFSFLFWMFASSSRMVANARFLVCAILFVTCLVEVSSFALSTPLNLPWVTFVTGCMRWISHALCLVSCTHSLLKYKRDDASFRNVERHHADFQSLSHQITSLKELLKSNQSNVSAVQGHWINGNAENDPRDCVDNGVMSYGPPVKVTGACPLSTSTPRKAPLLRLSKGEDSGISSDVLGMTFESVKRPKSRNERSGASTKKSEKRKSAAASKLMNEQSQLQDHNLSSHTYNLRSRISLVNLTKK